MNRIAIAAGFSNPCNDVTDGLRKCVHFRDSFYGEALHIPVLRRQEAFHHLSVSPSKLIAFVHLAPRTMLREAGEISALAYYMILFKLASEPWFLGRSIDTNEDPVVSMTVSRRYEKIYLVSAIVPVLGLCTVSVDHLCGSLGVNRGLLCRKILNS